MTSEEEETKRACAVVGELILITSALDNQLNQVCISVLALADSPMLEPLVASIDSARKVELLKAYASKITSAAWKKGLKDHAEAVEVVNRARNVAAHSTLSFQDGRAALHSIAAAKLFKSIDLKTKTTERIDLSELEKAIRKGEATLASGVNLLENFKRIAAERERAENRG